MSAWRGPVGVWDRFWFAPTRPEWLAVCRMVVALSLLIYLLRRPPWVETSILGVIPEIPHELWDPISYVALLGVGPPSTAGVIVVWTVTLLAGIALLLGTGTRVAATVAALGGLYLIALPFCFGKINHDMNVVAMALVLLPFARSGAALSIDAHLRGPDPTSPDPTSPDPTSPDPTSPDRTSPDRTSPDRTSPDRTSPDRTGAHGAYNWPVKLLQLSFALMLFFAGWHKVRRSGVEWAFSENLRTILIHHNLALREGYVSPFVAPVVENPGVWQAVAVAVMISELSFILIVFVRRWWLRAALFAGGAGFVLGLLFFMGFWNPETLVLLGMFPDWNRIVARSSRHRAAASPRSTGVNASPQAAG